MTDSGFDANAWVRAQLKDVRKLIENTEKRLADLRTQLTEEGRRWAVNAVEEILPQLRKYVGRLEATLERLKREQGED
jgi:hypothetical protein